MVKKKKGDITLQLLNDIYLVNHKSNCETTKAVFQQFRDMYGDDVFASWFFKIRLIVNENKTLVFITSHPIDILFKDRFRGFLDKTKKRFNVEWKCIDRYY